MRDRDKSKEQLIQELNALRQQVSQLEQRNGNPRLYGDRLNCAATPAVASDVDEFDIVVAERTAALKESNDRLVEEIVERTNAVRNLQRTKEQLQAILEAVPGIVSWISSDLRYLGVNRHLAEMFGLSPEDFVGRDIGFLGGGSEFGQFVEAFFNSSDRDGMRQVLARVRGEERTFLIVAKKYDDDRAAFTIGVDITQRRRAEEQVRNTKNQLEAILEAVPGIVSWVSADLRYLGVNRQLAETFELEREDFVGKDIGFLNASPDFIQFVRDFFGSDKNEAYREVSACVKGEQRNYLLVAQKYDYNDDRAAFIVGTDITQRRQAEEALKRSSDRLEALLEAVPGIVSWIGSDLHYLGVNRQLAETFGLSRADFTGKHIGFLGSSSDFNTFVSDFFTSSLIEDFRELSATINGRHRNYLIVAQKYDDNRAAFVIGIDITERRQAEEALRRTEEKYRTIFENTVEGIFQTTHDGRYLSANPALARIYGYDSPAQLIAEMTNIGEQLYVDAYRRSTFVNQLNKYDSVVDFESRVYRRDGTIIWVSENARAVRDRNGNLLYFEGTVEDISESKRAKEELQRAKDQLEMRVEERTAALKQSNHHLVREVAQRKRIEKALRVSEAELRALFAAMTDVITVFDRQGRYARIVSTKSEVLYSPKPEQLGKSVLEVLPRKVAQLFINTIDRALQTKETVNLEYSLLLPEREATPDDPEPPLQEIWFSASASPMPDDRVLWVARNVTERRRVLEALRQAEENYRGIFEHAAEGIFQTTAAGEFLSANPALVKMYGYDSLEDLKANLTDIERQLYVDRDRRQAFVSTLETEDSIFNFESRVYRKDGTIIWTSENARAVRNNNGELLYYEGTVEDITQRREAEAALRAEQEKSERLLLNILPPTVAEQLKQGQKAIAERFENVTILFADIVEFTQISARIPPTELVDLLNQMFSIFDRLAEQHGLEKVKTIGDAYMVAGGVPLSRSDSVESIAEMALDMQREIVQFKRDDGQAFSLRIGIHTGPVVAGVIGIKKFIYDMWGDTVNVASRMESQGYPGRIQVTSATYQHLEGKYILEPRGAIEVKGKGLMETYWLVDRLDSMNNEQ